MIGCLLGLVGVALLAYLGWLFVGTDVVAGRTYRADVHRMRSSWQNTPLAPAVVSQSRLGVAYAVITIPKIKVTAPIVQGVRIEDLRHGVGHYPYSAEIGEPGNLAFAGHRTTYAHPFGDLDKLKPGNLIHIEAAGRTFTYRVTRSFVVTPDRTDVVRMRDRPQPDAEWLTLTTCNPRYSARQRLVVRAVRD